MLNSGSKCYTDVESRKHFKIKEPVGDEHVANCYGDHRATFYLDHYFTKMILVNNPKDV